MYEANLSRGMMGSSITGGGLSSAGMANQAMAKPPEASQPPVSIQLDRLASLIGAAHKELEQLTKRLDPALGSTVSEAGGNVSAPEQFASCLLERRVIDAVDQVAELVRHMRKVHDALCI